MHDYPINQAGFATKAIHGGRQKINSVPFAIPFIKHRHLLLKQQNKEDVVLHWKKKAIFTVV